MEKRNYIELLSQKQFLKMLTADCINRFGDSIDQIAYGWIMFEVTGSEALMALIIGLNYLPSVLITPFAGAIVDRIKKKPIMIVADLIRFVIVAVIILSYKSGCLTPPLMIIMTLLTSTVEAFRVPASTSVLSHVLDTEFFTIGRAASFSSIRLSTLAGSAVAGIAIASIGADGALWIDAATFLISASLISWIRVTNDETTKDKMSLNVVLEDFREGFRFARKNEVLITIILVGISINGGITPVMVFDVPFISSFLKLGPEALSALGVTNTLGMAFGSFMIPKIKKERGGRIIGFSGIVMGALVFGFGSIPPNESTLFKYIAICGMIFLLGVCGGMINVITGSLFLKTIPKEMMGRLSGLMTASMMASMPTFSFICSALAFRLSLPIIFSIFGIGLILCYAWMSFRGKFKPI